MRQLGAVAVFCVFACAAMVANAEETPSPRGWSDTHTEAGRVLTKGTSKIVVGNWVDLQGRSVSAYLQTLEKSVPPNAQFVSSKGVKPDRLDGTFSVTRKVQLGQKQGQSVLYACPGQSGFTRILSLTFESSKFGDAMSGGMFLENACKTEVKGRSKVADSAPVTRPNSRPTPQSPSEPKAPQTGAELGSLGTDLARLNEAIPIRNRPVSARSILKQSWKGFPAQLTYTAHMMLEFPNGYSTDCTDWDLISGSPTPQSIGSSDCELTKENNAEKRLNGFEPGETLHKSFGRISADGIDAMDSSTSTLSGGEIAFSRDGRIVIGEFNAFFVNAGANASGAGGGNRKNTSGRYYLNGYTITVQTDSGEVFHSYIGWSSDSGSQNIDHIHFAGKHYWDRDK